MEKTESIELLFFSAFSGKDKKAEETTVRLNIEHSELEFTFIMDRAEIFPTEIAFSHQNTMTQIVT